MLNKSPRPVYLDLSEIKLPTAAIMSILHRISGVLMVLLIPAMIYLFQLSLSDPQSYQKLSLIFDSRLVQLIVFLLCWAVVHHFMAGIRFLLIDLEIGLNRPTYSRNACFVLYTAPIFALLLSWGLLR